MELNENSFNSKVAVFSMSDGNLISFPLNCFPSAVFFEGFRTTNFSFRRITNTLVKEVLPLVATFPIISQVL